MLKKFLFFSISVLFCCNYVYADDEYYDEFYDESSVEYSDDNVIIPQDRGLNDGADLLNVADFDIAGVMLGMQFEDVYHLFSDGGLYTPRKKNSVIYSIPDQWRYNLDYECRQQGTIIPADLEKCVKSLAKNRGLLYAAEYHLVRESTNETIDVFFTSNASDNKVYKIIYKNDTNEQEGEGEKFADQRKKRLKNFWKNVIDKYGAPNSGDDVWISDTNGSEPFMMIWPGQLELVNNGLKNRDSVTSVTQSTEYFKMKPYAF
ncbi:MAG: hypothetical protein ACLRFI_04075 [Alphaproteobacteria bacterium]